MSIIEDSPGKCSPDTNAELRWPYHQYYIGKKDQERRRNGRGETHWSGAESLEWYTGKFVRDTMHGEGDYFWRYEGDEGRFITYEGHFYGNCMHGYGLLSYPDGRVFNGLFYNNMRWGPGIETSTDLLENVGLWRGNQLVRLTWRPEVPSVTMDFTFGSASALAMVEPHRTLLIRRVRKIGEVNSAIELLKQSGAQPVLASKKWTKLYPKNCNDLASQVCHVAVFEHEYYKNQIEELEVIQSKHLHIQDTSDENTPTSFYAWNNSEMMISMMQHCFKHDKQRSRSGIKLMNILNGLRTNFKFVGKHEYDCRNLILASYLGLTQKVAQLINQENVHPDVADILGNTALMYAASGDQADIIHFLVEAGANVNSFNDSCCTPLAVALLNFACASNDVQPSAVVASLTPPPQPANTNLPPEEKPSEWYIIREMRSPQDINTLTKSTSKGKLKTKASLLNTKTNLDYKKSKTTSPQSDRSKIVLEPKQRSMSPEEILYNILKAELLGQLSERISLPAKSDPVFYLFEIKDNMATALDNIGKEEGKPSDKQKAQGPRPRAQSIPIKDNIKTSKDLIWQGSAANEGSIRISSAEKIKANALERTMSTISQLLSDGADPRLVRCPQPALRIAVVSGSCELVQMLVQKGADVNEIYPDANNYSILDIALSGPLTNENLALIRTILENGGTADHRLEWYDAEVLGPTLLHAVLAKNTEENYEKEICHQILELLLEYNANPLDQFKGSSAVDMAMVTKGIQFLDVFVRNPKTDLNAIINEDNQTILIKMFSIDFFRHDPMDERLQTLTNLLLYGADPLLECRELHFKYENIFVFAKHNLNEMEPKPVPVDGQNKSIKNLPSLDKQKKDNKLSKLPAKSVMDKSMKFQSKLGPEDIADYKQALALVTDCARILHMRWIQAKLFKELLGVVEKFEHRQWNMIYPEHKNKRACGYWLTMARCLDIWDILKAKKKKRVVDRRILKHILCIVHFYCDRVKTTLKRPLTAEEKDVIETDVCYLLREHMIAAKMTTEPEQRLSRPYVTPEFWVGAEAKFQICYECGLPLPADKLRCSFCKQVSFCSLGCMRLNVIEQNVGIHPCSDKLKIQHFATPI